jgi:hypothetical protein
MKSRTRWGASSAGGILYGILAFEVVASCKEDILWGMENPRNSAGGILYGILAFEVVASCKEDILWGMENPRDCGKS